MFELPNTDDVIARALAEDLGVSPRRLLDHSADPQDLLARDVTSAAVLPAGARFEGVVVAREACVVCGLPVAARVWAMLAQAADAKEAVDVFPTVAEGSAVEAGTVVAEVEGPAALVLVGERTALDFMAVLSGIATEARRWQEEAGEGLAVCDTRKTVPGLRALSKYAVRVGGAENHRSGLWDMVLVKDNHVRQAGGLLAAVRAAVEVAEDAGLLVEAEVESAEQAVEAAFAGADIVLIDNASDDVVAETVAAVKEACAESGATCLVEVSGGVTFERLGAIAAAGADRVSASGLTLAPPCDFGLDEKRASGGTGE